METEIWFTQTCLFLLNALYSLRLVQVIQLIIPETTSFAQDNSLKIENAFDLCNCDQISQTKTKFKSIFHLRECCPEPISSSNIQTKYTHSHTFSSMLIIYMYRNNSFFWWVEYFQSLCYQLLCHMVFHKSSCLRSWLLILITRYRKQNGLVREESI